MASALIGYTGFVGSNLLAQRNFDECYNSKNIDEMRGKTFSEVVCAGVQAMKWKANQDPAWDREGIEILEKVLENVKADRFVLISTIDVYPVLNDVDESFDCRSLPNHPYGTHRLDFERFCTSRFDQTTIVRLPGLFGQGLKKNVLYDLIHDNNLHAIQPESSFQYYSLSNLWNDIEKVLSEGIDLINLFPEPVATKEIISIFRDKTVGESAAPPMHYAVRTRYADLWNSPAAGFMKSKQQSLEEIRRFVSGTY